MPGIGRWFRGVAGVREAFDEPGVDSIRRLVLESARGGAHALDELASALFDVVADAERADQALDLLAAAGPKMWIDLDSALRPSLYGRHDPRVTRARLVRGMPNPLAVALAACGHDGRVRQRAIGHPAMRADVRLYPVLAIRAADWVGAVQDRALRVLEDVLPGADPAALLAVVPVVVRLTDRRRGQGAAALVRDALLRAGDDTLAAVRGCDDPRGRRFAFEVSLDAGRMDHGRLAKAALHESDIVARTRCAEALAAEAVARDRPEMLVELLDSASARVRVEALTGLVRLGHTEYGPRFLAEEASMMRLTAQWAVRRAGGDPAESYRRLLGASPRKGARGLLGGLGDCGTRDDAGLVVPYLGDPRPRVRAEAVRVLRRLGADVEVAAMLEDPAPVVVRNVVATLRASGPGVPVERLWTLLGPDSPPHVRQGAFRLLAGGDVWTRITTDLVLVGRRDEALSGRARGDLGAWYARDSARTFPDCPERLRGELDDLLREAEGAVPVEITRLLRWLIRSSPGTA
ncbi:hypothetical protein ACOZ38_23490 [Sphaerisporangium viridialbum]|uniref:hypothetical protein n=1 Tax=Sphaerisporangium viridialbum TaxID=46189 RepID=UPI003C78A724